MSAPEITPDPQDRGEDLTETGNPFALSQFQLDLVHCFAECGNYAETARKFSMSLAQLNGISRQLWWMEELQAIRRTKQALLDVKLSSIIGRSLERIEEALNEGEDYYDQQGNHHMKRVKAVEVARIFEGVFDRRQLLRELPTSISQEGGKLGELAQKLADLTRLQQERTIEMEERKEFDATPEGRRATAIAASPKLADLIEVVRGEKKDE